eukprot:TRINITY_DN4023_c0_g2_i1.p1 TRINITY_DN4023_c0_g2~~TRINITY_DN4023_c0_g2_i1.p1  ORF type:complete len:728 (+),score=210.27 TRINITY_DN4023_c0_g2_i1:53-2185(+)
MDGWSPGHSPGSRRAPLTPSDAQATSVRRRGVPAWADAIAEREFRARSVLELQQQHRHAADAAWLGRARSASRRAVSRRRPEETPPAPPSAAGVARAEQRCRGLISFSEDRGWRELAAALRAEVPRQPPPRLPTPLAVPTLLPPPTPTEPAADGRFAALHSALLLRAQPSDLFTMDGYLDQLQHRPRRPRGRLRPPPPGADPVLRMAVKRRRRRQVLRQPLPPLRRPIEPLQVSASPEAQRRPALLSSGLALLLEVSLGEPGPLHALQAVVPHCCHRSELPLVGALHDAEAASDATPWLLYLRSLLLTADQMQDPRLRSRLTSAGHRRRRRAARTIQREWRRLRYPDAARSPAAYPPAPGLRAVACCAGRSSALQAVLVDAGLRSLRTAAEAATLRRHWTALLPSGLTGLSTLFTASSVSESSLNYLSGLLSGGLAGVVERVRARWEPGLRRQYWQYLRTAVSLRRRRRRRLRAAVRLEAATASEHRRRRFLRWLQLTAQTAEEEAIMTSYRADLLLWLSSRRGRNPLPAGHGRYRRQPKPESPHHPAARSPETALGFSAMSSILLSSSSTMAGLAPGQSKLRERLRRELKTASSTVEVRLRDEERMREIEAEKRFRTRPDVVAQQGRQWASRASDRLTRPVPASAKASPVGDEPPMSPLVRAVIAAMSPTRPLSAPAPAPARRKKGAYAHPVSIRSEPHRTLPPRSAGQ